jgi:hypothetical protein
MCTSAQEIAVAKPLGCGQKLSTKSSGHSIAEKASIAGIGIDGGKLKRALNLFGSDSLGSDEGTTPFQRPRKRAKGSSISKQVVEPALTRGMFEQFVCYSLCCRYCSNLFFVFFVQMTRRYLHLLMSIGRLSVRMFI